MMGDNQRPEDFGLPVADATAALGNPNYRRPTVRPWPQLLEGVEWCIEHDRQCWEGSAGCVATEGWEAANPEDCVLAPLYIGEPHADQTEADVQL